MTTLEETESGLFQLEVVVGSGGGGGGGAWTGVTRVDLILGVSATDGTATVFEVLQSSPGSGAAGVVPAGWESVFNVPDVATLQGFLTSAGMADGATVLVPGDAPFVYTITSATITAPWVAVTAELLVKPSDPALWGITDGATLSVIDGKSVGVLGTGLLSDASNTYDAVRFLEGILDRPHYVTAMSLSANVNVAAFGAASWEYGALRFDDGNGGAVDRCYVFLDGQTTPGENGLWSIQTGTFTGTQLAFPDILSLGHGVTRTLACPGDPHHGLEITYLDGDASKYQRVSEGSTGSTSSGNNEWIITFDPTASGGGGSVATDTIWDAAGDLAVGTGANTAARLAIGAAGTVLASTGTTAAWTAPRTVIAVLAADDSATSTTTLADVGGWAISYVSGDTIRFEADVFYTGDAAGDLKVGATFANASVVASLTGISDAASSAPANQQHQGTITASGGSVNVGCQTGTQFARLVGTIRATGTGTLQLQHAQRSSSATPTTILAGSCLTSHRTP